MKINKFRFGMRGHDLGTSLEEMCKNAQLNNIDNLQFAPVKTMHNINFDDMGYNEKVAESIKSMLDMYGLKISVLGCYINPINQDTLNLHLNRFENFISYAKFLNADVIGTETGWISDFKISDAELAYATFMNSLERLLICAEKHNVCIGLEPVWSTTVYSSRVMKKVLDYFKSDNLYVIFDPVNLLNKDNFVLHREIVDEAIELYGDMIKTVHLKDCVNNTALTRVPVGTGACDIAYWLKKIGELKNIPDIIFDEMPLENLSGVCERVKKIYN